MITKKDNVNNNNNSNIKYFIFFPCFSNKTFSNIFMVGKICVCVRNHDDERKIKKRKNLKVITLSNVIPFTVFESNEVSW
jgi:hypothetical protein